MPWIRVLAVERAESDWIQDPFLSIVSAGLADVYGVGFTEGVLDASQVFVWTSRWLMVTFSEIGEQGKD